MHNFFVFDLEAIFYFYENLDILSKQSHCTCKIS